MSDYKPTGEFYMRGPLPILLLRIRSIQSLNRSVHMLILFRVTEHDGLRKDGEPDQRVNTGQFAQGKVDPVEAGKQGGQTGGQAGGENSGGSTKGQFAHGKVDPVEAGKKGGS